jgi:hypothetical protein
MAKKDAALCGKYAFHQIRIGMVVSVLECSDYLRGVKYLVECDHTALQPLFQKQFKGAIYERWLSLLQQFNFEIQYKPADQMQLPSIQSFGTITNNVGFLFWIIWVDLI